MCIKVDNRMGCYHCGYPDNEAVFFENPLIRCDDAQYTYKRIQRLSVEVKNLCETLQRDWLDLGAAPVDIENCAYAVVLSEIIQELEK